MQIIPKSNIRLSYIFLWISKKKQVRMIKFIVWSNSIPKRNKLKASIWNESESEWPSYLCKSLPRLTRTVKFVISNILRNQLKFYLTHPLIPLCIPKASVVFNNRLKLFQNPTLWSLFWQTFHLHHLHYEKKKKIIYQEKSKRP